MFLSVRFFHKYGRKKHRNTTGINFLFPSKFKSSCKDCDVYVLLLPKSGCNKGVYRWKVCFLHYGRRAGQLLLASELNEKNNLKNSIDYVCCLSDIHNFVLYAARLPFSRHRSSLSEACSIAFQSLQFLCCQTLGKYWYTYMLLLSFDWKLVGRLNDR